MKNLKILNNLELVASIFKNRFFEKIDIQELTNSNRNEVDLLIEQKTLIQKNNDLFINFDKKSLIYLKKLVDQMKFEQIDLKLQNEILFIKNILFKEYRNRIFSIFVVGSTARNTSNLDSDLDILVIHSGEKIVLPKIANHIINIQVITYTTEKFSLEKLEDSELLIWALKYGLLIYDKNFIFKKVQAFRSLDYHNQIIQKKRVQIDYMCNTFEVMLKSENENMKNTLDMLNKILHLVSRYIILLNGVFPLSRPELKKQIYDYDSGIVNIYEQLERGNLSKNELIELYFSLKKNFQDFVIKKNNYL